MKRLPAILAFLLLAYQAAIPWTTAPYVTQDGPSYVYTAAIARDLALHPHGYYSGLYRFQPKLVMNWTPALILGVFIPVFGAPHAEAALASLCVIVGFFGIAYWRRSLDPLDSGFDPLTNFLVNTWFFWIGFYSFCLGAGVSAVLSGFYIRHAAGLSRTQAALLATGLVASFFTHVLPTLMALLVIALAAVWARPPRAARNRTLAALAPAAMLLIFFVRPSLGRIPFVPAAGWAWRLFPMHVFTSAAGIAGEERLLVPAMLVYICAAFALMKRDEWNTIRGALALAAALCFAAYLLAPNTGFGGGEIKIRFSWYLFVFGCTAAAQTRRLRPLRSMVSLYAAALVLAGLIPAMQNARRISRAADEYAAALAAIPPHSTFVRLRYQSRDARRRLNFDSSPSEPLMHLDAWYAARNQCIDLTDYQALNRLYAVTFRRFTITGEQQNWLFLSEDGEAHGFAPLRRALETVPVRIEYVVMLGDEGAEATRASDFRQAAAWLDAAARLVSRNSFVRVYQTAQPR